jgi:hypothetical protein
MLLKKINSEWAPAENRHLEVGDTLEVTDYKALVENGLAIIVNEKGEEQPMPGTVFVCPICFTTTEKIEDFTDHVLNAHKKTEKVAEDIKPEVKTEVKTSKWTEEERKAFGAKMRAAREAKKNA